MNVKENEQYITADNKKISYSGRIDFSNPLEPIFVFPGSAVHIVYTGSKLKILIRNNHSYYNNYVGYILDNVEKKVLLSNDNQTEEIVLADDLLEDKEHDILIFKRQDACHEFTFYGFIVSKDGCILESHSKRRKCMEFYGEDSTAGKLSEDLDYAYKLELKNNGEYSNAWHSYAMITARNLKAQVNIIAQEGISLMKHEGYIYETELISMEKIYDKLHFNPDISEVMDWDFKRYTPHVVVIEIGQNDAMSEDYMEKVANGEKVKVWKEHYIQFVLNIRKKYPYALIVLTTTIMNHNSSVDRAIGSICQNINDQKIVHFLYSCNGYCTPYNVRVPEAEQMAFELSVFLKGLGNEIWAN